MYGNEDTQRSYYFQSVTNDGTLEGFYVEASTEEEATFKAVFRQIGEDAMSLEKKIALMTAAARLRSFKRNLGIDPREIWGPDWENAIMDQSGVTQPELEEAYGAEFMHTGKGVSENMKISDEFPSKYLSGDDVVKLGGKIQCQIDRVTKEQTKDFDSENPEDTVDSIVVYFVGAKKGLILSKGRAIDLSQGLGDDTDLWVGKVINLYTVKKDVFGKVKDVIHCEVAQPGQPVQAAPAPVAQSTPGNPGF